MIVTNGGGVWGRLPLVLDYRSIQEKAVTVSSIMHALGSREAFLLLSTLHDFLFQ